MGVMRGLLLLLLLGVFHDAEASCDGRKDGAQCYGALGGSVDIRLMDSASEIFDWKKETTVILRGRRNRIVSNLIQSRSSFTPSNGTFKINELSRTDGGEYILETTDQTGANPTRRTLHLTIQAPVSSVQLVSRCLSQGEMRVSCSSEGGDSPQYSWTLDGNTLMDTQLLSGSKDSQIITLKQNEQGQLICLVRNQISVQTKETEISSCGFKLFDCTLINGTYIKQWLIPTSEIQCMETTTEGKKTDMTVPYTPSTNTTSSNYTERWSSGGDLWYIKNWKIMAGVLSVLVIFLVTGILIIKVWKKKPQEEQEEQELTYADVKIVQRPGRQAQSREGLEVEYGQIKISERPRRPAEPTGDECVYAKVRRGR